MREWGLRRSLRVAWASVRASAVPMVALWTAAAATVVAYYLLPGFAEALEPLARWQRNCGKGAAFLNRAFFCGLLPGLFLVTMSSIRPRRPLLVVVAQVIWSGLSGILTDVMYSLNALWFGTGVDIRTLAMKTAVCQFAWAPLVFTLPGAVFCFWIGCDFSWRRVRNEWPDDYWRVGYLPFLISNWVVWIPVLMAVHVFPTTLQIQLSGLAGSFWTLLGLELGRRVCVRG